MRRTSKGAGTLTVAQYKALESEASFQKRVIEYAEKHGWQVVHVTPARWVPGHGLVPDAEQRGFPDLMFLRPVDGVRRPYGLIFAELKTERGRIRQGQPEWQRALQDAGIPCFLWRPSSWGEIETVLR